MKKRMLVIISAALLILAFIINDPVFSVPAVTVISIIGIAKFLILAAKGGFFN